ncbi:deoxynucleoside kinase, partial [Candidatus Woesearchaeota archaeon]|nr:deoxynucleoside kinase [Candidatus Woesearchaeota archaeon]
MVNFRIGIIGNIGVGKSTLVDIAAKGPHSSTLLSALGAGSGVIHFTEVINQSVLEEFYKDPVANAFLAQIEFLNARVERQKKVDSYDGIVLEDRTLKEDYYIFGRAQKLLGNMSVAEFETYEKTFNLMAGDASEPDLLVYLKADVPVLLERIAERSRGGEKLIEESYLSKLGELYEDFVTSHCSCPVLVVDANEQAPDVETFMVAVVE